MFSMHTWYILYLDHRIRDIGYCALNELLHAHSSSTPLPVSNNTHFLPAFPHSASRTSTPLVFCIRISDLKPKDNADLNSLTNLLNELLYTAQRLVVVILYLHPVVFRLKSQTVHW